MFSDFICPNFNEDPYLIWNEIKVGFHGLHHFIRNAAVLYWKEKTESKTAEGK